MKPESIILAVIVPLALSTAVPDKKDIDIDDLNQKEVLDPPKVCKLKAPRQHWTFPCACSEDSGTWTKSSNIRLVCHSKDKFNNWWYQTKAGEWVQNMFGQCENPTAIKGQPDCEL
ncbi:hypothetical protein BO82DRAFT_364297 [Aspergillus uvarum CBS 121591]|uniref:Cyanovirin-N domain-containing protein n=1 Tax=Aspergillus uvarum CBS 121591 TaxID=1448315 RepID=A0A319C9X7_9EURO|nr:hypothetical protein BO82DRAFT_364297 [Aspergillus uvarum CBS 121591]PYH82255.1 hypothetical protein BO82DRAFT_364297 [Aspergillus uvarum CBS 121591]